MHFMDAKSKVEIAAAVNNIRWFHQIDLGNGIVTPGFDRSRMLQCLGLPSDLTGKSVLDIGAWDGFFSFEAERRNAKRVLATDAFIWQGRGWGSQNGFNLAREVLHSKVEAEIIDVHDMSAQHPGRFDIVLFLGVLYHLKHPLLALERVFDVTEEFLILETHIDLTNIDRPAIAFYPGAEVGGDGSNWYGPNVPALLAMLKTVGFSRTEVNWASPIEQPASPDQYASARAIFHAWR
jgi:tRNA (mo5U34)-methyltransferase